MNAMQEDRVLSDELTFWSALRRWINGGYVQCNHKLYYYGGFACCLLHRWHLGEHIFHGSDKNVKKGALNE